MIAVSALVLGGACGLAKADVFRWVDEKGEAHYTDTWVPGAEVVKSSGKSNVARPTPSQPSDQKPVNTAAAHASGQLAAKSNADAVKQDVAKAREQQCKQAKERYTAAIQARRIYKEGKDKGDDRQFMSDQEADAYRQQMRNDVKETCGSVPPSPTE